MIKNEHKEFARAVIALARKYKINQVDMHFRPEHINHVNEDHLANEVITLDWEVAHSTNKGKIKLSNNSSQHIDEDEPPIT